MDGWMDGWMDFRSFMWLFSYSVFDEMQREMHSAFQPRVELYIFLKTIYAKVFV